MDIFESLCDVHGGDEVKAEFLESLHGLPQDGLFADDDMLYDKPTPRPKRASRPGRSGHQRHTFRNSWRVRGRAKHGMFVLPSRCGAGACRAVYRPCVAPASIAHNQSYADTARTLLSYFASSMESIHTVTRGVQPCASYGVSVPAPQVHTVCQM